MSGKTGLELTREVVKRVREDMKKAGGTMTVEELFFEIDELEAFEKWAKSHYPEANIERSESEYRYYLASEWWAAWQARAALAATPAADMGNPIAQSNQQVATAAPVVLPEPVGYLVTKLEAPIVGSELKINRSIYTKNEPTGKHQKLYTEQQLSALLAPKPAIMPKGDSAAAQLRAMATNYPHGHGWDKLDAKACIRGALEIESLRALLDTGGQGQEVKCSACGLAGIHACTGTPIPPVTQVDEENLSAVMQDIFSAAASQQEEALDAESEYQRGYRHGYNRRDAEVQGALL